MPCVWANRKIFETKNHWQPTPKVAQTHQNKTKQKYKIKSLGSLCEPKRECLKPKCSAKANLIWSKAMMKLPCYNHGGNLGIQIQIIKHEVLSSTILMYSTRVELLSSQSCLILRTFMWGKKYMFENNNQWKPNPEMLQTNCFF